MLNQVFLDMDPGIDDAAAIMMLSTFNYWKITGISTVSGNVDVEKTTENAAKIASAIKLDAPVFKGASRPLVKRAHAAYGVHGRDGLGNSNLSYDIGVTSNKYGPVAMINSARKNEDLWLLATGPLTNVAIATILEPDFPIMVKGLVIMGGAFNMNNYGKGNVTEHAEFNIWADPEAAAIVFSSFQNASVIGLDVTANPSVWISKDEINSLKETKRSNVLRKITENFIKKYGAFVPHDPIAAYYLVHPETFKTEEHCIKIKTGKHRGMTVLYDSGDCTKVKIASYVNAQLFKNSFLKSMETH